MNVFKVNKWIIFFFFTAPCLFFSQIPCLVSLFYFIFFIFYFLTLKTITTSFENRNTMIRNKIECLILLAICSISASFFIFNRDLNLNEISRVLFSLTYFGMAVDISLGFRKLILKDKNKPNSISNTATIFLCFLVPPLGIFHLQYLYNQNNK